jgi:hypothetical protein
MSRSGQRVILPTICQISTSRSPPIGDLVSLFRVLVSAAQQNWPEVRTMMVIVPGTLVAVVLMSLHGLWVARLLRQTGAQALCSWVLLSASLLLLLPSLGVILALVALRRIRESDGRLSGRRGAYV